MLQVYPTAQMYSLGAAQNWPSSRIACFGWGSHPQCPNPPLSLWVRDPI